MRPVLMGFVVGGLLWGLWVLLWRAPSWPVVLAGLAFPAGIYVFLRARRVSLDYPVSVLRFDLWAMFFALVVWRIILAVFRTAGVILMGRSQPAVIAVPLALRSELAQLLLLWAITVTPGTIALLVDQNVLYVHCLPGPARPEALALSRTIRILKRIWG